MKRRSIVLILAVVITGFLLLPLSMGFLAKRQLEQSVASDTLQPFIAAKVLSYEQGWFSSQTLVRVTVSNQAINKVYEKYDMHTAALEQPLSFTIPLKIYHTPLVMHTDFSGKMKIRFGVLFAAGSILDHSQQVVVSFQMHEHFNGKSTIHYFSPSYEAYFKNRSVAWNHMLGTWKLFSQGKKVQEKFSVDNLLLSTPSLRLTLHNFQYATDKQEASSGLWYGNSQVNISSGDFFFKDRYYLLAQKLSLMSNATLHNKVMDTSFDGQFQRLFFKGEEYGPGDWQLVLKNVDAATMEDVNVFLKHLLLSPKDLDVVTPKSIANKEKALSTLLSRGFKAQLQAFDIRTPSGNMNLQAWLTLPNMYEDNYKSLPKLYNGGEGSFLLTISKENLENAMVLFFINHYKKDGLPTEFEFNAARVLGVDNLAKTIAEQTITQWLQEHWLVEENGQYEITGAYKNGNFYINEQKIL